MSSQHWVLHLRFVTNRSQTPGNRSYLHLALQLESVALASRFPFEVLEKILTLSYQGFLLLQHFLNVASLLSLGPQFRYVVTQAWWKRKNLL